MRRVALTLALLCAAVAPATVVGQAHPDAMLEDAALFRGALRGPVANVTIRDGERTQVARLRVEEDALSITLDGAEPARWATDDADAPFARRLLAAALTGGDLVDAVAGLGFRLDPTLLGMEVLDDGTLVHRLGGSHASVTLEPGIHRPREIRILSGDRYFVARLVEYGEVGRGWFPTRVEMEIDGAVVSELTVSDLARSAGDLAPVSAPATVPAIRFPRLPL